MNKTLSFLRLAGLFLFINWCGIVSAVNQPDLTVTGITWTPANPVVGNTVTFSVLVKNLGTAPTPANTIVSVAFTVDGTLVNWSNNSTVSLPNGGAYIFTLTANGGPNGTSTWSALFGTHTLNAWVDDANRIAELNESNNQFSTSISVAAPPGGNLPDLIVTDLVWSPSNPAVGTAIQFTGTVKNQGAAATPSGNLVTVAYLVDGTLVNWTHNLAPVIYPGAISIEPADGGPNGINTWTVTSGTHTVEARVDENNIIAESNESNNTLTATLTMGGGTQPPAAPTGLIATAGNA